MTVKICPSCGKVLNFVQVGDKLKCSQAPFCSYYEISPNIVKSVESLNYMVVDTETTGKNDLKSHWVTEIGSCTKDDDFDTFCAPRTEDGYIKAIPLQIQQLTHITNEDVLNAPSQYEAFKKWLDWVESKGECFVFVAHNAVFDIKFIINSLLPYKDLLTRFYRLFPEYIDTLEIAKIVLDGKVVNFKEETLAEYYNIQLNAHRANNDSKALSNIFELMVKDMNLSPYIHSMPRKRKG